MRTASAAGPVYTTPAQAKADTERLLMAGRVGAAPWALLALIEQVVLNPRSSSDTLLIHADALREAASPMEGTPAGLALVRIANTLTDIAPTRANSIEAPA
jgi:hypothetical protein